MLTVQFVTGQLKLQGENRNYIGANALQTLTLSVRHIVIFLMLISISTFTNARSVTLGISFSIPPYVILEDDSGLELDIIKEAFRISGHDVVPLYMPLDRSFKLYESNQLDGVINVKKGMVKGYFSSDVITFQNCAVTLKKNKFTIDSLADLKGKRIAAFQNARKLLGLPFAEVVGELAYYREVARQRLQINMLFLDRVDAVILDRNIFDYFRRKVYESIDFPHEIIAKKVAYHCIFKPAKYKLAFHDEVLRDDFDKGLKVIRDNGTYEYIQKSYQNRVKLIKPSR